MCQVSLWRVRDEMVFVAKMVLFDLYEFTVHSAQCAWTRRIQLTICFLLNCVLCDISAK